MQPDFLYTKARRYEILKHRLWPDDFPNTSNRKDVKIFDLTKENRKSIKDYHFYLEKQNYSLPRLIRILEMMAGLMEMHGKGLATATKHDIQGENGLLMKILERWDNDTTKEMEIKALKRFFKFIYQTQDYPEPVKGILFQKKKGIKLLEIPTEEKIAELIQTFHNPIYKALVATLYASGGRIGEIATLRVRDLAFEGDECVVSIMHSKTDQRKILLTDSSVQILRDALKAHPHRNMENFPDSYIFVSLDPRKYGLPFCYAAIAKIIKIAAKKVGLEGLHAHTLRHARATHLIQHGLSETQLKVFLGHSFSSRHTGRYLHLASKDIFNSIRQATGKAKPAEKQNPLQAKNCLVCGFVNDFTQTICRQCQRPLGIVERLQYHDKLNETQEKMHMLERSMNILLETLRNNPSQALNNPEIAKQVIENARKNSTPTTGEMIQ